MRPDEAIARIAADQYGLFTTSQADAVKMTATMLRRRREAGLIARREPGVWRMVAVPESWEQRVLAAAYAENGLASHRTAAALWAMDSFRPGVVEILTQRWRRRPNRSFRIHETRSLDDADRSTVRGIPTTSKARTVVDLGAVVPALRVEQALDTHGVDPEEVWDCSERLLSRGRPHVFEVRKLVAARLGRECVPPNTFENLLLRMLRRARLELPEPQIVIRRPDGSFLARVDWCFVRAKVVIECDSYLHHGQWVRRKRDLRRDRELTALGYRVLRVSWEDLTQLPDQTVADIVGVLTLAA
jgi:very-short-patch-repair endonuclease